MNKISTRILSTLISVTLLAVGIIGATLFVKSKPQAQRTRRMSSMVPVVETRPLIVSSQALKVDCLGTVIADKTAAIQPEVNGRIIAVNAFLVEGERVKKGDVLVEIEAADYQLALQKAEANLLTAQSNFRIEEGQQDVVRHELKLMGVDASDSHRDLLLREPQLKVVEAAVKSAELAVESAKLDLKRTKIRAPFDAVVVFTDADVGDYAQSSKTLIELAATDRYFVRASVPLSALEPLPMIGEQPYSAEITLSDGTQRKAQTYKLLPDLTEKGRMARILLSVDAPYATGKGRPLLLNEYVRVCIAGKSVEKASLIPRSYLRDGNVVWMMDSQGKLKVLPAEVLQGYADDVLVRVTPEAGSELITSDLAAEVDGMQLRRVGEQPPAQPADKGAGSGKGTSQKDKDMRPSDGSDGVPQKQQGAQP